MTHYVAMDKEERESRPGIPRDTFEHRLMLARSHAGRLSIQDAAAKVGVKHQSWSNWERGIRPRDIIDVAELISEKLGIDRDWLLFGGQLAAPEGRTVRRVRPNAGSVRVAERMTPEPIPAAASADRPTRCAPDVRSSAVRGIHRRPKARQSAVEPIAA